MHTYIYAALYEFVIYACASYVYYNPAIIFMNMGQIGTDVNVLYNYELIHPVCYFIGKP